MKLKLMNLDTPLVIQGVNGYNKFLYGENRDCYEINFEKGVYSLDHLDQIFSVPDDLQNITIIDDTDPANPKEYIHVGYRLKDSIQTVTTVIQEATADTPAVTMENVRVTICRENFTENTLKRIEAYIKDPNAGDISLVDRISVLDEMVNGLIMPNP